MLTIILAIVVVLAIYYFVNLNSDYFEKQNVKFRRGVPGLGFIVDSYIMKKHIADIFGDLYKQFSDTKIFGMFEFHRPIYVIRDIELIKQVTVKEFDHFVNHRMTIDENVDRLFGRSLFIMRDQKWRDMRATLSPAFTGSKMRQMFKLVMEVANENMKYLQEKSKNSHLDVELSDLCTRYSNDVIAKCAFGITLNSLKDRDNEFYTMGINFVRFSKWSEIKFFLYSAMPAVAKFFKLRLFDKSVDKFFNELLMGSIEYREKNNIVIPDMVNLLMQARKDGSIRVEDDNSYKDAGFATVEESETIHKGATRITKWTDDDLVAQSMIFFLAGFDTVSTAMCFVGHLLAVNPEVQETLIREIDDLKEELDGKLPTYENIQNMEYLDMVVSECLRMWTPATIIDRQCNKPFVIEDHDGNKIQINKGDGLLVPVHAIHHDAKYFPNPEKFDPERFSKANRDNILPFTYSPFGIGPRNCIGSRFALMECKAVIVSILSNFRLERNDRTDDPIKLKPDTFNLRAKNGFHVRLRSRN